MIIFETILGSNSKGCQFYQKYEEYIDIKKINEYAYRQGIIESFTSIISLYSRNTGKLLPINMLWDGIIAIKNCVKMIDNKVNSSTQNNFAITIIKRLTESSNAEIKFLTSQQFIDELIYSLTDTLKSYLGKEEANKFVNQISTLFRYNKLNRKKSCNRVRKAMQSQILDQISVKHQDNDNELNRIKDEMRILTKKQNSNKNKMEKLEKKIENIVISSMAKIKKEETKQNNEYLDRDFANQLEKLNWDVEHENCDNMEIAILNCLEMYLLRSQESDAIKLCNWRISLLETADSCGWEVAKIVGQNSTSSLEFNITDVLAAHIDLLSHNNANNNKPIISNIQNEPIKILINNPLFRSADLSRHIFQTKIN